MTIHTLTIDELHAIPYELTAREDGTYMTSIDHDDHDQDAEDCELCDAELEAIRASLPDGWSAEWTGNGNGTESDVSVYFAADPQ